MENRSSLLGVIQKWHAVSGNPSFTPESKEWKNAHAAYESALYEAGVYKEALRGQRALSEDVRTNTTEPERTFFHWAYCYAVLKTETLKELQKAKSYAGRAVILDGIQATFHKAELKKEETRKTACQRRTADLIEEARLDHERAEHYKTAHKMNADALSQTMTPGIGRQAVK